MGEWFNVILIVALVYALAKAASFAVDWLDAHQLGPTQDDDDDDDDWPEHTA